MAQTSDSLATRLAITHYDFDPDSANATDVAWVDMNGFDKIIVSFFRTVGTGALDTFALIGNSASDGSGTDVTLVTHAVGSEPDAVGDYIFLECNVQQMAQEAADSGNDVRYVSVSAEFATATDEGVVTYIRSATRAYDGLTADSIA